MDTTIVAMEQESFTISLVGETLTVIPQEDETYIIIKDGRKLAVIEPEWIDNELTWVSADLISADYVRQIGELIEEHDM